MNQLNQNQNQTVLNDIKSTLSIPPELEEPISIKSKEDEVLIPTKSEVEFQRTVETGVDVEKKMYRVKEKRLRGAKKRYQIRVGKDVPTKDKVEYLSSKKKDTDSNRFAPKLTTVNSVGCSACFELGHDWKQCTSIWPVHVDSPGCLNCGSETHKFEACPREYIERNWHFKLGRRPSPTEENLDNNGERPVNTSTSPPKEKKNPLIEENVDVSGLYQTNRHFTIPATASLKFPFRLFFRFIGGSGITLLLLGLVRRGIGWPTVAKLFQAFIHGDYTNLFSLGLSTFLRFLPSFFKSLFLFYAAYKLLVCKMQHQVTMKVALKFRESFVSDEEPVMDLRTDSSRRVDLKHMDPKLITVPIVTQPAGLFKMFHLTSKVVRNSLRSIHRRLFEYHNPDYVQKFRYYQELTFSHEMVSQTHTETNVRPDLQEDILWEKVMYAVTHTHTPNIDRHNYMDRVVANSAIVSYMIAKTYQKDLRTLPFWRASVPTRT